MNLYGSINKKLNESSSDSKYVDAYLDLVLSMNDGLGDVEGNIEWTEILADDYNIKYDKDFIYSNMDVILKKALTAQIKKDPKEFKNGVESFIEYNLLEYGDDEYLYSKVHKEPDLLNDITVLLDYLNKNNGNKKLIEGLQNIIGNIDNIAINSRQIGEELCRYMNDKDIYKYLGTNVRFWTKNGLVGELPPGYTCMVGSTFNLLLFKHSNTLEGLAVLFKDSKTEVVAEIFTFGHNDESYAKNVIIYDNFKPTGDTFVITPENKEQMFRKIFNAFKNTVNKLKVENMKSEKEYKKYWGKSDNEYQKHLKDYSYRLKNVGVKESVNVNGAYEEPLTDEEIEILQNDKTKFNEYLINKQKKSLQKASYEKLKLARSANNRSIKGLSNGTPGYWSDNEFTAGMTKEDFINDYKKQNEEIDTEINERIDKLIDDFSKDPSNKELFNKTLNDISKLEYDGVINKDLYNDAIKRTQSVYVNRNKDINESENLNESAIYFIGKDEYGIVENNGTSDSEFDVLNMYYKDNLYSTELIPKNWPESKIRAFMSKVSNFVGPRGDRDFVQEVEDEFKVKDNLNEGQWISNSLDTWVDPRSQVDGWKVKILDVIPDEYGGSTTAKVELFDPKGKSQGEDIIYIHRQKVKIGKTYKAYIDGIMAMPRIIGVEDFTLDEVPDMKEVTKDLYR